MNTQSNKAGLSEEDIKLRYITPAILANWDLSQIRMEFPFTDGRVMVRGKHTARGKRKAADYLLSYRENVPLAIVEAKDNTHPLGGGMQQALLYAEILDLPFAYSSNGDAFLEHDRLNGVETEIPLDKFPTPEELWQRYKALKNVSPAEEKLITQPYYYQAKGKSPRYYQRIAINRTLEAIAKKQQRILLAMATGTGKTYTAFQIAWRLWKSGQKKRILYLADRNILVDQAMRDDFKPFHDVMTKIKGRYLDSAYELYFSLYHQLAGEDGDEPFRDFKPEFFDLVIVDECHRGSAKEESKWRKILDYFSSATHIGMTATPKETSSVSNSSYFGKPVYTYSLKQGIDDGFLAPYKVIRVGLNKDISGYTPEKGKLDKYGNPVEEKDYKLKDFDRELVIDERTETVARRITEFLKVNDRYAKTIVFCVDTEHAARMRQALINLNSDMVKENSRYVVRITHDEYDKDNDLEDFTDVKSQFPVIVTTSELMSTGVDCKTCKLIVLDKEINSDIEFKQIIGRGTRLRPDYGKEYFTIMDFRGATAMFANDDFWVPPEPDENFTPEGSGPRPGSGTSSDPRKKVYINGVDVEIQSEKVSYYDADGKHITESLTDYSRRNLLGEYARLDDFLQAWNRTGRKQAIIEELKQRGVLLEALREASGQAEMDDFDLICHIAWDKKPLTRIERAERVRKSSYLNKYSGIAREVLDALLDKYAQYGVSQLEDTKILSIEPFLSMGGGIAIAREFGGRDKFLQTLEELQNQIYAA